MIEKKQVKQYLFEIDNETVYSVNRILASFFTKSFSSKTSFPEDEPFLYTCFSSEKEHIVSIQEDQYVEITFNEQGLKKEIEIVVFDKNSAYLPVSYDSYSLVA